MREFTKEWDDYIAFPNQQFRFQDPAHYAEIIVVFRGVNYGSSCDVDGLLIRPIRCVTDIMSNHIGHILKSCFLSGVLPNRIQVAKVTVLLKKVDRKYLETIHQFQLYQCFVKAWEGKVIQARLVTFTRY